MAKSLQNEICKHGSEQQEEISKLDKRVDEFPQEVGESMRCAYFSSLFLVDTLMCASQRIDVKRNQQRHFGICRN